VADKVIHVPESGAVISFPDTMSDDEVSARVRQFTNPQHVNTHGLSGPPDEPGPLGQVLTAPYQQIGQGISDIAGGSPWEGAARLGLGTAGVLAPVGLAAMTTRAVPATLASMGVGYGTSRLAKHLGLSEPIADALGLATSVGTGKLMPGLAGGLPPTLRKYLDIIPSRPGTRIDEFLKPTPPPKVAPAPKGPAAPKPAKIGPLTFPGRFNEPEPPTPVIPPVTYPGRFAAPPTEPPTIPPVTYPGRFNEPAPVMITPKIPPVTPGRSFQPPETPAPPVTIPPLSFPGRFTEPPAPPPVIPPVRWNSPVKVESAPSLTGANTPKVPQGEPMPNLPPLSWADANRQLHHTMQNMELPGSPVGTKAPAGSITTVAKDVFGAKGAPDLTPEQVQSITNFVVKNRRLPTAADKALFK
jgi:hypothetical protein